MKALIIGYGSPIRGDDAIGPLAADRSTACSNKAPCRTGSRSSRATSSPPNWSRTSNAPTWPSSSTPPPTRPPARSAAARCKPDATALSTMAHFHDPRELLAWCEALYGKAPTAWLGELSLPNRIILAPLTRSRAGQPGDVPTP
jgi:hydrogenase maturation protease